jgi:hypothetical protein
MTKSGAVGAGRVRESGMPERMLWESYFEPKVVIQSFGISCNSRVLELGAGYGTFSEAVASQCRELVMSEVDASLAQDVTSRINDASCQNVSMINGDFFELQHFRDLGKFDEILLFNILHMEQPIPFLEGLRELCVTNSKIHVMHWRTDVETPRGPPLAIRSTPDQCVQWLESAGFSYYRIVPLKGAIHHFGLTFSASPLS